MRDPLCDDPAVQAQQAEEDAREQRWADFVIFVNHAHIPVLLKHVADLMDGRQNWYMGGTPVYRALLAFEETEGWHGVLTAIGRALREQAQVRRELMDRR